MERYFSPDYKNPNGAYVREDGIELQPIRPMRRRRADQPNEPTLAVNTRAFPTRGRFALRVEAYREKLKNAIPYDDPGKKDRKALQPKTDFVASARDFDLGANLKLESERLVPIDPKKPCRALGLV